MNKEDHGTYKVQYYQKVLETYSPKKSTVIFTQDWEVLIKATQETSILLC